MSISSCISLVRVCKLPACIILHSKFSPADLCLSGKHCNSQGNELIIFISLKKKRSEKAIPVNYLTTFNTKKAIKRKIKKSNYLFRKKLLLCHRQKEVKLKIVHKFINLC